MPRTLTASESSDLLLRNYSLSARVLAHKALVATGRWSQVQTAPGMFDIDLFQLPIPPQGFALKDDKYGNVIVFPDTAGVLHYTGDNIASVTGAVQNPPFESPTPSIEDGLAAAAAAAARALQSSFMTIVFALVIVGVAWAAFHEL